jgi:membrane-associated phospholipid phosphatase
MPEFLSLPIRIGILSFCIVIWLGQFFLINHATSNKKTKKLWAMDWDSAIPFLPQTIFPYLSVYIFAILPFILIDEARLFFYTLLGYAIITLIGSGIHILSPSQVFRYEKLEPEGISLTTIYWYQRLCKPYDNFPSTHVAFSILAVGICYLRSGLMLGVVFMFWAVLIALSTLTTKQHYMLDIVSGSVLGVSVFILIVLLY